MAARGPPASPQRGTEATMLLVLNAHHDLVKFTLPGAGRRIAVALADRHERAGKGRPAGLQDRGILQSNRAILLLFVLA